MNYLWLFPPLIFFKCPKFFYISNKDKLLAKHVGDTLFISHWYAPLKSKVYTISNAYINLDYLPPPPPLPTNKKTKKTSNAKTKNYM